MRIGILGAGRMAQALGGRWREAGHEVLSGARDPRRAGPGAESLATAATFGEAVLLAVPDHAALEVLAAVGAGGGALRGRTLIDCTNPLVPGTVRLATEGGPSMAERIAAAAPGAHVVKAFNLCPDEVWRMTPPVFDGVPLGVPLCGDQETALALVGTLVADLGCVPVAGGGLERAGLLEAAAAFMIGLWAQGAQARAVLPWVGADAPRPTLGRRQDPADEPETAER
ncbi:NADPH-dependent F420 reductase [Streptomyces hoynatensis]|uniref:NADP oxidoreductase n=1 Tax=Streptomyces hoynatensis TaxID=1141874 RepID=A0A3A9Z6I0_9ACTN|nr:NAD(P)-binding domain-containing protein [Streptomyces hoynatensis]RKN42927.1 NADP oxidoreductase [Streptomyces hoynatensis]